MGKEQNSSNTIPEKIPDSGKKLRMSEILKFLFMTYQADFGTTHKNNVTC